MIYTQRRLTLVPTSDVKVVLFFNVMKYENLGSVTAVLFDCPNTKLYGSEAGFMLPVFSA